MPFIGRDWRSPGEAWVKTETLGWQRMKIIESQLHPACHQSPTCSWPPRSEFGQHMASYCKRHDRINHERNPSEFRDSLSSNSSSDSSGGSRAGSTSPSPTSSPEKNLHHIYPITISSPYGQYSCCNHHFESGSPPRLTTYNRHYHNEKHSIDNSQQTNAQQLLSRSLSPESIRINNQANKNSQRMRYNNSVSDFRNSPSKNDELNHVTSASHKQEVTSINQYNVEYDQQSGPSDPVLMKNGSKVDDIDTNCEQVNSTPAQIEYQKQSDIENQNSQIGTCCCASPNQGLQNICHIKEPYVRTAPHCRISVRTREVAMYNTISEAFYRLDFCNAIHDIRRFNYICKLLHLLITQNLTSLSGCATKVLFTMLEQVAWEGKSEVKLCSIMFAGMSNDMIVVCVITVPLVLTCLSNLSQCRVISGIFMCLKICLMN